MKKKLTETRTPFAGNSPSLVGLLPTPRARSRAGRQCSRPRSTPTPEFRCFRVTRSRRDVGIGVRSGREGGRSVREWHLSGLIARDRPEQREKCKGGVGSKTGGGEGTRLHKRGSGSAEDGEGPRRPPEGILDDAGDSPPPVFASGGSKRHQAFGRTEAKRRPESPGRHGCRDAQSMALRRCRPEKYPCGRIKNLPSATAMMPKNRC